MLTEEAYALDGGEAPEVDNARLTKLLGQADTWHRDPEVCRRKEMFDLDGGLAHADEAACR